MKQQSKFNVFNHRNKPMVFAGSIYDIVKEETNYVVKVYDDEARPELFFATFTCTPEQFKTIDFKTKSDKGVFVMEVSKIITSNPAIKVDEDNDANQTYSSIHLTNDCEQMIQTFSGKLIDLELDDIGGN